MLKALAADLSLSCRSAVVPCCWYSSDHSPRQSFKAPKCYLAQVSRAAQKNVVMVYFNTSRYGLLVLLTHVCCLAVAAT